MKKSVFITILVGILIASGILISRDSENESDTNSESNNTASVTVEDVIGAGEYVDYSPEVLANVDHDRRILFFKADWCPTCNILEKDIEDNLDKIPENTVIIQADFDKETELKKQYKVASQHTLIELDNNNEEIKKWSAILSLEDLLLVTSS